MLRVTAVRKDFENEKTSLRASYSIECFAMLLQLLFVCMAAKWLKWKTRGTPKNDVELKVVKAL